MDHLYNAAIKYPMLLHNFLLYSIKLYISITISRFSTLFIWALFNSLMQSVNSAQCLNITCLLFLSASIVGSIAPCLTNVIVPFTNIYVSLQSQRLDFYIIGLNLMFLCHMVHVYHILF